MRVNMESSSSENLCCEEDIVVLMLLLMESLVLVESGEQKLGRRHCYSEFGMDSLLWELVDHDVSTDKNLSMAVVESLYFLIFNDTQ